MLFYVIWFNMCKDTYGAYFYFLYLECMMMSKISTNRYYIEATCSAANTHENIISAPSATSLRGWGGFSGTSAQSPTAHPAADEASAVAKTGISNQNSAWCFVAFLPFFFFFWFLFILYVQIAEFLTFSFILNSVKN